jgi:autotransporter adhesin
LTIEEIRAQIAEQTRRLEKKLNRGLASGMAMNSLKYRWKDGLQGAVGLGVYGGEVGGAAGFMYQNGDYAGNGSITFNGDEVGAGVGLTMQIW